MELMNLENGKVTSLELVKEINFFRGIKITLGTDPSLKELRHDTLRNIIKDEFEEEILSQEILEKSLPSDGGRPTKVFYLTLNQAKQVLVRESKVVRKAVIKRLDELENKLPQLSELEMIAKIAASHVRQEKRIEKLEYKFENILTIDSNKQRKLQKAIASRVYSRVKFICVELTVNSKENRAKLFSGIHRELKNKFGVSSYKDVKDCEFEIALNFVSNWIEDSEVRNG